MSQTLEQLTEAQDGRCLGPLDDKLINLRLFQGQTLRWMIALCDVDKYTISAIDPLTDTLELDEQTCIQAGDCVYVKGHDNQCSDWLINGSHEVGSTSADGSSITVTTDILFPATQTFQSLPSVPGCDDSEPVVPPTLCRMAKQNLSYCGTITNRYPTQDTRLAIAGTTTAGSNIVCISDKGQVHEGDVVNIPRAGITDAKVCRVYCEHGQDWIELDQNANYTGCSAMSTEVGVLAEFKFIINSCGMVQAIITDDVIRKLPLMGEKTNPKRGENCGPHYRIGVYSITASYINECLDVESELIAHGCVELYPTTKKAVPCCS